MSARAAIVIPARFASERFPGKPLHIIAGKPLLRHVWERCRKVRNARLVIVATDDMRIAEGAFDFGAEVALTSSRHPSGTDRVAEVAAKLRGYGIIVNVQGDEPLIAPALIERLIASFDGRPKCGMVTAAAPFSDPREAADPNRVKVVLAADGKALYFSRSLIPHARGDGSEKKIAAPLKHLGIYAYRRAFLLRYVGWRQTPLERTERLEQLRALEMGVGIHVVKTSHDSPGVDTPDDAEAIGRRLARRHHSR